MNFHFPTNSLLFPVVFFFLSFFSLSSAQSSFWSSFCGTTGNYTGNTPFATNLNALLSTITTAGRNNFYNLTIDGEKSGDGWVTGIAYCRADLPWSDCQSSCTDAANGIRQVCPNQKEAIGWYRSCMVRYSDRPIWGKMESSPWIKFLNQDNASNPEVFDRQLMELLSGLQTQAAAEIGVKWAAGSRRVSGSQSVYAVLQCTPDLNSVDCLKCLGDLIDHIPSCCAGKTGSAVLAPSCGSRFDVFHFYGSIADANSPQGNNREKGKSSKIIYVPIAASISATILLGIVIWICLRRRKRREAVTTTNCREMNDTILAESLQYDLNTIKVATNYFSFENKLGVGGFGEVYKGILKNGQKIAVKRLSKTSGQGISEFITEVDLVAKLQHKNLVKLLGFCLESEEKILIYEFLPNSSLDRFLFEQTVSTSMAWDTRFKIILGIARGLLYLHEDSRLKVIHRDLKASNILLDESMNPKISDFGLAKLFDMEQTQGDTKRIVGTYGYMAPEYAMTGHFSEKSDVFSFGVIILEIVSGQKNKYYPRSQVQEALLHRAWRLWNEKKILDLADPAMRSDYRTEELTKCIHIGLLSVQENPTRRPKMTSIVAALNGDSISLPMPKGPHFLETITPFGENMEAFDSYTVIDNITQIHPR